jgi:hypothetical protein
MARRPLTDNEIRDFFYRLRFRAIFWIVLSAYLLICWIGGASLWFVATMLLLALVLRS